MTKQKYMVDFDANLPKYMKKSIRKTTIYQNYLKQRKQLGELIERHLKSGGKLSDERIVYEYRQLEQLAVELDQLICKEKDVLR